MSLVQLLILSIEYYYVIVIALLYSVASVHYEMFCKQNIAISSHNWLTLPVKKSSPPTIKKSNNQYPEPRARIYHATRHVHIRGKCCLSLHCSRPCHVPFIQRSDSWSEPRRSLVPDPGWSTHRVRGSRPVDTRTFRSFSVTPPSHLNKIFCHLLSQD